jgi:hypothetical protein
MEILKINEEQRILYGWASVTTKGGEPVIDSHNDIIETATLERAVTQFMLNLRVAKEMHVGDKIGDVVHSLPLTAEIAKALGIASDQEGWIVGMKIYDDAVWEKVKSGEYRAFSIGGKAKPRRI